MLCHSRRRRCSSQVDQDMSRVIPDVGTRLLQAGWTPDKTLSWVGPVPEHKAAPQAKETNVYLQYIVDHYEQLPDTIVFMHAHR